MACLKRRLIRLLIFWLSDIYIQRRTTWEWISHQKIIAGLHYEDLIENISEEFLDELLEQGVIECLSPYYDAPRDQCSFGVNVIDGKEWVSVELEEYTILPKITAALSSFKKITGADGKILFGAHVY